MIEILRRLLKLEDEELRSCPDFSSALDHFGFVEGDDIADIREAMQEELDALEAAGEDADPGDAGGQAETAH